MPAVSKTFHIPPLGVLRVPMSSLKGQPTYVIIRSNGRDADDEDVVEGGTSSAATNNAQTVAEVFGSSLPVDVVVALPLGKMIPILSPKGCSCVVEAEPEIVNHVTVSAVPYTNYQRSVVALHEALEAKRQSARKQGLDGIGPRLLVVGNVPSSGKSTLCRTLANYAIRLGYHPLYVDLDVGLPQLGFPECLNVYALQYCLDSEDGGSLAVPGMHLLLGKDKPHLSSGLWRHAVDQAGNLLLQRAARSDRCRVSGVFIDYPTLDETMMEEFDDEDALPVEQRSARINPLEELFVAIEVLEVDTLLVVGSEALEYRIAKLAERKASGKNISLYGAVLQSRCNSATSQEDHGSIKCAVPTIPSEIRLQSGAVCSIVSFPSCSSAPPPPCPEDIEAAKKKRWLEYFFGTTALPLKPSMVEVSLKQMKLVQVGGVSLSSMQGLLPIDEDVSSVDPAVITYLQPSDVNLTGRILAVSCATYSSSLDAGDNKARDDFETRVKSLVTSGFVLVRRATHSSMTLLIPEPQLPCTEGLCFLVTNTVLLTS